MNFLTPSKLGALLLLCLMTGAVVPVMAQQAMPNSPPAGQTGTASPESLGLMNKLFVPERQAPRQPLQQPAGPNNQGRKVIVTSTTYDLPMPDYLSKKPVRLNKKERQAVKLSGEWINRNISPVMHSNGKVMYVFGATLPTIVCSPLMACDLELQAGESVNDVIVGDTARWLVVVGKSGFPGMESTHLVLKPLDAGLITTAVITTDRRTYHLKLVSQRKNYTPYVGFIYPEEQQAAMRQQLARQERQTEWKTAKTETGQTVDLTTLDFAYSVIGEARWKPLQVYSDGTRTIIRLPLAATQSDLPVLLVEKAGEEALVNYRVKRQERGTSLIVDEIFEKAMLIAGVGSDQQKIEIIRQEIN